MFFIPNFLSLYQHFIKQELLVNVKRELQPFELTLRKSFFAQKAVHHTVNLLAMFNSFAVPIAIEKRRF